MSLPGFSHFTIAYFDTDLWVSIPETKSLSDISDFVELETRALRNQLDQYILKRPAFKESHEPLNGSFNDGIEVVDNMLCAANIAGVGPMAAVAGAIAEIIGKKIMGHFLIDQVVVENGGDIYLNIKSDINISIYAGTSPLSNRVGVSIPRGSCPLGISTSSATVGHSFSYGKADAVMVVAQDTALSDAYATAICNKVQCEGDVAKVIDSIKLTHDILSCVIVMNDILGITGKYELKIFEP